MDTLQISSTGRGINYVPEYHADATGKFAAVGLEVIAKPQDPWELVLSDLASDASDVVLGGLWVPALYAGSDRELTAIGQINARFPMAIVTRDPIAGFTWADLAGKTVLAPGVGGTAPYEFTAGVIRAAGGLPAGVRFMRDLSTPMMYELWGNGTGDAFIADPLTAQKIVAAGTGSISLRLAEVGGVMPNSVYYVKRSRIPELRDRLERFIGVVGTSMRSLDAGHDVDGAAATAERLIPGAAPAVLRAAIDDMIATDVWSSSRIERSASENWTAILHEAGLLPQPVSHEQIVDDSIVEAVEQAQQVA